jgi:signal recognition particle subunit SRP54
MFDNLTNRLSDALRNLSGRGHLSEDNIQESMREVRRALLEADVALPVVNSFIHQVQLAAVGEAIHKSLTPGQAFIKIVQQELTTLMGSQHQPLQLQTTPPAVLLMVGLQGAGKTTTVAKLGQFLQKSKKRKILVASTDLYRPAAREQLQRLAEAIGVDFFSSNDANPVEIARAAHQQARLKCYEILIVDTAGRLHIDNRMMQEIQQIHQVLNPIETLFVLDATVGQDTVTMAKAFDNQLPLTGIILSKADGDTRGGAALSVRQVTGKPIKFLGVGEKSDALEPFHPERMASRILGMGDVLSLIEELEEKTDPKKKEQWVNQFKQGVRFDFEDFRDQLQQMKKMGGMMGVLNKLPGAHQLPGHLKSQLDDKMFTRMEAVINSMTRQERQLKVVMKASRKRRIAQGAGVPVQMVNQLLKQFEEMQQMMKKMRSGGVGKMMRGFQGLLPPGLMGR